MAKCNSADEVRIWFGEGPLIPGGYLFNDDPRPTCEGYEGLPCTGYDATGTPIEHSEWTGYLTLPNTHDVGIVVLDRHTDIPLPAGAAGDPIAVLPAPLGGLATALHIDVVAVTSRTGPREPRPRAHSGTPRAAPRVGSGVLEHPAGEDHPDLAVGVEAAIPARASQAHRKVAAQRVGVARFGLELEEGTDGRLGRCRIGYGGA